MGFDVHKSHIDSTKVQKPVYGLFLGIALYGYCSFVVDKPPQTHDGQAHGYIQCRECFQWTVIQKSPITKFYASLVVTVEFAHILVLIQLGHEFVVVQHDQHFFSVESDPFLVVFFASFDKPRVEGLQTAFSQIVLQEVRDGLLTARLNSRVLL